MKFYQAVTIQDKTDIDKMLVSVHDRYLSIHEKGPLTESLKDSVKQAGRGYERISKLHF